MRPFNPEQPLFLKTDSSGFVITGIASQTSAEESGDSAKGGHRHPFAFFSRKMNVTEQNYVTGDQELLAIVASFKAWRHYFEGVKYIITIISDHNNLKYFLEAKPLSRWQAHWAEFLAEFDFTIIYWPGKKNPADAPSQRPDYQPEGPEAFKLIPFFKLALESPPVKGEEVLLLLNNEFTHLALEATAEAHEDGKQALNNIETHNLLLLNDNEWALSEPRSPNTNDKRMLPHTLLEDIEQETKTDPWAEKLASDSHFTWKEGLLYHKGTKIYVPDNLAVKLRIMSAFHNTPTVGHQGRDKTLNHIKLYFYWEGLYKFVDEYVQSCEVCQCTKGSKRSPAGELLPLPVPDQLFSHITMDFITDLPVSIEELGTPPFDAICHSPETP